MPLRQSIDRLALGVCASFLFVAAPVHASENPATTPPNQPQTCQANNGNNNSFYHYGEIGSVAYDKADMLTLARKPATTGYYLGKNPGGFDDFVAASYTQNPAGNREKLYLTIQKNVLDASILLPSSLEVKRVSSAEIIEKSGAIRQVLTADTLANVIPLAEGYHVKVYDRNVKGSKDSAGLYTVPASVDPLTEWIMHTPDGGAFTNTIESVYIDRRNAGGTRVEVIRYSKGNEGGNETRTKATYAGSLLESGYLVGSLLETDVVRFIARGSRPLDYTLVREVSRSTTTAAGPQYSQPLELVSRRLEEYKDFTPNEAGGNGSYKRLVRAVDGYGSDDEHETRYDFYDTSFQIPGVVDENGNPVTGHNLLVHGRLKSVVKPDGNWEYYEYTDFEGSATFQQVKYSAWRDASFGFAPDGSQADLASAKKEVTSVGSTTGYTKVVSHGGVNTSREEFSSIPQADGSLFNKLTYKNGADVTLSVRVWSLHSSTAAPHLAGRIAWMENPDGTAETYTYTATSNGGFTLVHRKGAGDRYGVTAGTETTTEYNSFAEACAESVKDIESGLVLNFWIAPSVDILGRPTRIEYNGNENDYETFEYSCCGLARKRNRDASVTTWTRDPLKRVYLRNDYRFADDPAPLNTTTTFDGLTTTVTRGGILQSETTVLLNGETALVKTPDQDNDGTPETTTLTYASGGRVVTTTHPDGGTEIRINHRDGTLKSLTGTAVPDRTYTYGTHTNGLWKQETKLAFGGSTGEWVKTYSDALDRVVKVERPHGSSLAVENYKYYAVSLSQTAVNSSQGTVGGYGNDMLIATDPNVSFSTTPGGRTKLYYYSDADGKKISYEYDAEGRLSKSWEEMPSGQTRFTQKAESVVNDTTLGVCHQEVTTVNSKVTNVSLRSGDGHSSRTSSLGRVTTTIKTVADAAGNSTATTTNPDGTRDVRTTTGNLLEQIATEDMQGDELLSKSYTYDALRRVASITDARTGTTTVNGYTAAGQPLSQTDPGNRTTAFAYDVMGRKVMVDAPDTQDASGATLANITHTSYHPTGQEKATWGDQTYPVFKGYDEQGRMNELRTYRTLAHGTEPTAATGGFDLTSWTYNSLGLLANKRYADNQGPNYTYTPGGKLATRTWARGVVTSYSYDKGLLTSTDYSDATPDVTIAYDAFGRQTSVTQTNQSRIDYTYDPATLALDTETIAYDLDHDGTADFTRVLDRSRDSLQRDTGWQLKNGTTVENQVAYQYGATDGRLASVSGGAFQAPSLFQYTYVPGSSLIATVTSPAHTVTNTYETTRDALTLKENKVGSTVISRFEYGVNALGQRTNVATIGTAFTGTPTWDWGYNARGEVTQADSSVTAFDRAYEYDAIGNRKKSADSLTLPSEDNYTANALNQYSSLQLNPQSAIANPQYDADGNMTSGPLLTAPTTNSALVWDGENRLIETQVGTSGPLVRYLYDSQSRRIAKITGGVAELTVYDAWNPIAEYTRSAGVPPVLSQSYTWGTDLSGTLQGAGGVGGLLSLTHHATPSAPSFFPTYDGNGNVSEYLDSNGAVAAHFEYDAFGRVVATTGSASDFSVRFSTKKEDAETGLNYYGYRYYDPTTGRWPSRDPIKERGGVNLYGMVENDALSRVDVHGKVPFPGGGNPYDPSGKGGGGPKEPGLEDNLPGNYPPNGYYQNWMDQNAASEIEQWKNSVKSYVASQVDCNQKTESVDAYSSEGSMGSKGSLYRVALSTPSISIVWNGCDWTFETTLTASNTFGPSPNDSSSDNWMENGLNDFYDGQSRDLGSWDVSGEGSCR